MILSVAKESNTYDHRKMILFVAGEGLNSVRARENLLRVCEDRLKGRYDLEVVDVLKDYKAALAHNILVTPALLVTEPPPKVTVLGDLSDTSKLLKALQLDLTA